MFAHSSPRAVLPVRALKFVYDLPADQPDRFSALLARLARSDDQDRDAA